ncbi:hypothetical protein VRRI112168_20425 [Vreelandella rituensis]
MLIAEDGELLLDIGLDVAGNQAQKPQRQQDGQWQRDPHVEPAQCQHADDGSHHAHGVEPQDLAERLKRGAGIGGDGAQVVHPEPAQKGQRNQKYQPDETGVLNPGLGARFDATDQGAAGTLQFHGRAGDGAENAHGHDQRNQDLHGGDAEVAQAGVHAQGIPLLLFREERGDVAHRAGEVAAADAGEQCQGLEDPERGVRVPQGEAGARRRDHQQRRGQEDGVAPTGNADHEGRRDTQRGAGKPGQGGQGEQLVNRKGKPQVLHLGGDHAPHQPDSEAHQQAGNRDPQVAGGNALALASPEGIVFDLPLMQVAIQSRLVVQALIIDVGISHLHPP